MPYWYYLAGVQGTVLGIAVDLSALPYFLHSFPGPHRAGIPDRLVLVGSDCASRRRAVIRGSAHPWLETQVGVGGGVWPGLPVGEAVRRRARVASERCSSLARPSGQRLDRPSGLSFRYLGQPRSCALFATSSAGPSLCWEASP